MSHTSSPTECSSPANDSIPKVIKNDSIRYKQKGYGLIFALLQTLIFFYYVPNATKSLWPSFAAYFPDDRTFYVFGIVIIHTSSALVFNLAMYIVYTSKIPFFEKYRVLNKAWPWEADPVWWRKQIRKALINIATTHFVIIPLLTWTDTKDGVTMRLDIESFPDLMEIGTQLFFFSICEDFFFYWSHRLLHHPKIYRHVHKMHHEFNITVSIASEYAHPVEVIFSNILPTNAGPKILAGRVHFATYLIWVVLRMFESADGHSGYEFSWSPFRLLPLSGSSMYHNFHHYQNVGNYCSLFTFWDTLCGTNKHYFEHLKKKEKKELEKKGN